MKSALRLEKKSSDFADSMLKQYVPWKVIPCFEQPHVHVLDEVEVGPLNCCFSSKRSPYSSGLTI